MLIYVGKRVHVLLLCMLSLLYYITCIVPLFNGCDYIYTVFIRDMICAIPTKFLSGIYNLI